MSDYHNLCNSFIIGLYKHLIILLTPWFNPTTSLIFPLLNKTWHWEENEWVTYESMSNLFLQFHIEEFRGQTLLVGQQSSGYSLSWQFRCNFIFIIELELSTTDTQTSDELLSNLTAALSLQQDIISSIQDENSALSIAFTVYNSPALFPVRNTSQNTTVSSTVVGSQVVSVQVGGIVDGTILASPVTFQLRLLNSPTIGANKFISSRRCVFWDFKAASKSPMKY